MRIIAGARRGHRIASLPGPDLRPTSDMVREAIFDILREEVEDKLVLDIFAGTGALGLEALSRGASRVIFVERDREHAALVRRNIATLRYEDRATIAQADAYRWSRSFQPLGATPFLVFVDPPYKEFDLRPKLMRQIFEGLGAKLPAGSTFIAESGRPIEDVLPEADAWDRRRYGSRHLYMRTLEGPSAPAEDDGEVERLQPEA